MIESEREDGAFTIQSHAFFVKRQNISNTTCIFLFRLYCKETKSLNSGMTTTACFHHRTHND